MNVPICGTSVTVPSLNDLWHTFVFGQITVWIVTSFPHLWQQFDHRNEEKGDLGGRLYVNKNPNPNPIKSLICKEFF